MKKPYLFCHPLDRLLKDLTELPVEVGILFCILGQPHQELTKVDLLVWTFTHYVRWMYVVGNESTLSNFEQGMPGIKHV